MQVAMPLAIRPSPFPPDHARVAIRGGFTGQLGVTHGDFTLSLDYLPSEPGAWIITEEGSIYAPC